MQEMIRLVVYSEGVMDYNTAWTLSPDEINMFAKTLKELNDKKSGKNTTML